MEMIEISGYVMEEKLEIAKRYLIPKLREETGVKDDDISFLDSSLIYLIDKHCRESGVRNLQKKIQRIFRKSAIKGLFALLKKRVLPYYIGPHFRF